MKETFEPLGEFEQLPQRIALRIREAGWPIVDDIDVPFGAAKIPDKPHSKAVWTKIGRRVTVTILTTPGGGLIVTQSKEIDPLYTERKKNGNRIGNSSQL